MADMSQSEFERLRLMMAGACVRPMVHDANNYLGAALAYTELAQMEPGMSAKAVRQLGEVVGAITRCSRLMNLFAQLVRPMRNPQEYSLVELVEETLELRLYAFRVDGVQVKTEFSPDLQPVFGFPAATQYALLTILLDIEHRLVDVRGERSMQIRVAPLGDHAAVRFNIHATATNPGDGTVGPGAMPATQELTIESARAGIRAQNGSIVERPDGEYVLSLPFVRSADALVREKVIRDA